MSHPSPACGGGKLPSGRGDSRGEGAPRPPAFDSPASKSDINANFSGSRDVGRIVRGAWVPEGVPDALGALAKTLLLRMGAFGAASRRPARGRFAPSTSEGAR